MNSSVYTYLLVNEQRVLCFKVDFRCRVVSYALAQKKSHVEIILYARKTPRKASLISKASFFHAIYVRFTNGAIVSIYVEVEHCSTFYAAVCVSQGFTQ